MATIKKKLKVINITVINSKGEKQIIFTAPGEKVRNIKQYVFKRTDGNAVYISHTEQELTYEMDLAEFLKHAVISGNEETETGNAEKEQEENKE